MRIIMYKYLAFALLAWAIGCGEPGGKSEEPPQGERDLNQLRIEKGAFEQGGFSLDTIHSEIVPVPIKLNGKIDVPPNNRVVISALLGGFVKDIPILEGERVKKNQFLATVENLEFLEIQRNYLAGAQDLRYLEAEYERQRQLFEERISSEKKFQQTENEFRGRQIEQGKLREILRMLHFDPEGLDKEALRSSAPVLSPFDGHVSRVFVHAGVHLAPGEPMMEVVNTDHIHIELKVYEKDVPKLSLAQKVRFKIPEISDKLFTGELYQIGKVVLEDRTVLAHVHLDEAAHGNFMPGMYVEAEIQIGEKSEYLVHKTAVTRSGFKHFAYEMVDFSDQQYVFERRSIPVKNELADHYVLPDSLGHWQGKVLLIGNVHGAADN